MYSYIYIYSNDEDSKFLVSHNEIHKNLPIHYTKKKISINFNYKKITLDRLLSQQNIIKYYNQKSI